MNLDWKIYGIFQLRSIQSNKKRSKSFLVVFFVDKNVGEEILQNFI